MCNYLQREIAKWSNRVRYYTFSRNLLSVLKFLFFLKRSGFKTSVISYVLVFHSLTGVSLGTQARREREGGMRCACLIKHCWSSWFAAANQVNNMDFQIYFYFCSFQIMTFSKTVKYVHKRASALKKKSNLKFNSLSNIHIFKLAFAFNHTAFKIHSQNAYFQKFKREHAPASLEAPASGARLVLLLIGTHPRAKKDLPTDLEYAVLFSVCVARVYNLWHFLYPCESSTDGKEEQHTECVDWKKTEHYTALLIGRCCENFFLCDTHKTKDTSFSSTLDVDMLNVNGSCLFAFTILCLIFFPKFLPQNTERDLSALLNQRFDKTSQIASIRLSTYPSY